MIRIAVLSLALLMMSGCVVYAPYEVAATAPWQDEPIQYVDSDPVYETYVVSPYYPWASMDYFYLGNHYYRPAYGFSYSVGFYSGFGWYPPYYGPWYVPAYYSAWYAPFYGYPYAYYGAGYGSWYGWGHSYRRPVYPRHAYRPPVGSHGNDRPGRGDGNYAGAGGRGGIQDGGDYRSGIDNNTRERESMSRVRGTHSRLNPEQLDRNVAIAPSSDGTDRGMVVVNRNNNKIGPSRTEPVASPPRPTRTVPVAPPPRPQPQHERSSPSTGFRQAPDRSDGDGSRGRYRDRDENGA